MSKARINFTVPAGWHELTDKQLLFVYKLLAADFSADEVKLLCLLKWNRVEVVGRTDSDHYILRLKNDFFEVTPLAMAELLPALDWLQQLPAFPVRLKKLHGGKALPADFSEVPFETFIICDNLYQGYLATHDESILESLGSTLYNKSMRLKPHERISIFYWFASLKGWLATKYADFLQPAAEAAAGNLLGTPSLDVEAAMNAQLRALTKGDVTKEAAVLALDTHRALAELNAQAREYKELNSKLNKS